MDDPPEFHDVGLELDIRSALLNLHSALAVIVNRSRRTGPRTARDEAREQNAQAMVCLIEGLEEVRPYVGTEAW
jgi:hypothetical protein